MTYVMPESSGTLDPLSYHARSISEFPLLLTQYLPL